MNLLLAITGASGAIYAKQFIDAFRANHQPSTIDHQLLHIVASQNGIRIFHDELGLDLKKYWPKLVDKNNFDVPFVSGSNPADVMVVMPCSMGTLGRIAHGFSDDVITRAADVCLKERKKLILVVRETPLSLVHIENMRLLTLAGAIILPASPSFYSGPKTIEELANTVVARVLDLVGVENSISKRWVSS